MILKAYVSVSKAHGFICQSFFFLFLNEDMSLIRY